MTDYSKRYADWIAEELHLEVGRQERHESRGLSLITLSGTLLAVLVAVRGLARTDLVAVSHRQDLVLAFGVSALVLSSALGLVTQMLKPRLALSVIGLRNLVGEGRWTDDDAVASNAIAQLQIERIETLRNRSRWTALVVGAGQWIQLLGLAALAAALLWRFWS
jgi:hypothetical protein